MLVVVFNTCKLISINTCEKLICDWIWEKPPSMHNYVYLEIQILIIEVLYLKKKNMLATIL